MQLTTLQKKALLGALRDPAFVALARRLAPWGLHLAVYGDLGPVFVPWSTIDPAQTANDNFALGGPSALIATLDSLDLGSGTSAAEARLPDAARTPDAWQDRDCFPDQGAKLRYLVRIHGDRRERSRTNRLMARSADDGGHPRDHRSPIVFTYAGLAGFLETSPGEISRWVNDKKRIPDRFLPEICRLYAIDEAMLRTASLVIFIDAYATAHF